MQVRLRLVPVFDRLPPPIKKLLPLIDSEPTPFRVSPYRVARLSMHAIIPI